jgi:hypothetical protein
VRGRGVSGALEVVERCGQAKWLVEEERAAVRGLHYVPAAGPVEPVLFDLADPRPVLAGVNDEVAGIPAGAYRTRLAVLSASKAASDVTSMRSWMRSRTVLTSQGSQSRTMMSGYGC